jgi:hypothetical protein
VVKIHHFAIKIPKQHGQWNFLKISKKIITFQDLKKKKVAKDFGTIGIHFKLSSFKTVIFS